MKHVLLPGLTAVVCLGGGRQSDDDEGMNEYKFD